MPIDLTLSERQRTLKWQAREFAREVLRPAVERADGLPTEGHGTVAEIG